MWTSVRSPYNGGAEASIAAELVTTVGRRLRARGVAVSTADMLDAVRALNAVDVERHDQVIEALRACLVKTEGLDDVFDRVVRPLVVRVRPGARPGDVEPHAGPSADSYGADSHAADSHDGPRPHSHDGPLARPNEEPGEGPQRMTDADLATALRGALSRGDDEEIERLLRMSVDRFGGLDPGRDAGVATSAEHHVQRVLRGMGLSRLLHDLLRASGDGDDPPDALERRGSVDEAREQVAALRRRIEELVAEHLSSAEPDQLAPPLPNLEDLPLLRARPDELLALRAAVRPLARRLASRLGRRRQRGRGTVDMRRTIRNSLGAGGVPLVPVMRRRRRSRPDLVVLCDVSGSTAQFAPFTLALLPALHREFGRVRSFVFVDGIVEITTLVETATGVVDARHLLAHRGLIAGDGRSDYARALRAFLDRWPEVVTPKTTVLIVGDARSHDRGTASAEMRQLGTVSRRLYWLNPEPREEWNTGDSDLDAYRADCSGVFEVSTLRQLGECVAAIS